MKRINWQRRWRTVFLGFLFCCGVIFSPIITHARISPPPVHAQMTESNLLQQAQTSYQTEEYEQAAQLWQQLADQYQRQGDDLNQGMALSNLSLSYQQLGEWQAAREATEASLNLLQNRPTTSESQKILAQSLEVQGRLEWEIGQSEKSIEIWKKAANIYKELGETAAIQKNLLNQAKALQDLGFYPKSCQKLLQIVNIETSLEDGCDLSIQMGESTKIEELLKQPQSDLTFEVLERLGNIERIIGALDQSKILLEKSLEIAKNQGDNQEIATTYLSLGNIRWAILERDYQQALSEATTLDAQETGKQTYAEGLSSLDNQEIPLQFYEQAFQTATFPFTQLQAQLNILTLYIKTFTLYTESGLLEEATEYQNKAIDYTNIIEPPLPRFLPSRTSIYTQIKYANELIKLNKKIGLPEINQIDDTLKIAISKAQKLGDQGDHKAESYGLGTLGKLYENKDWQLARNFTQQALNLAPTYNHPELAYQLSWQLGRIYQDQEDREKAITAYRNAYNTLQSIRGDLAAISPEVQFSFRDNVEPVYRELVDLLLRDAEDLKESGKQEELQTRMLEVREVIESLQLAELNNFFRDACVKTNREVIDKVSPTATVIYPIILKDSLEIVVSFPNANSNESTFNIYNTQVSREDLVSKLGEFREILALDGRNVPEEAPDELLSLSQQIYNWLMKPIEQDLNKSQVDTLVFVLDGGFRNIPMAALHDGEKYLVEKYQIALTPGLQLLNPEPLTQEDLIGLLAGAENAPSFQQEGLSPLDGVDDELIGVSETLTNYEKRLNEEFTLDNIRDLINQIPFGVVHLATHGKFGSSAEETFILAHNGRIDVKNMDNLLRKPDEENPIELLVLSACETIAGDDRSALGLAGVALRAGARSTVATLWTVSDASTASFMVKFYEELAKPDNNKAEALRNAQLKLLRNEENDTGISTRHPFYWSPFILVGNWQ